MPYPPDSVVHSFGADAYRVEFRSTGTDVVPRVIHVQTGRQVQTTELDAGFQLRIQDERSKAAELLRSQQQSKPTPAPESADAKFLREQREREEWRDHVRRRDAELERQRDDGRDFDR